MLNDFFFQIWDMGTADLFSQGSYRFAHTDSITGMSASNENQNIFVTCSLDKSCLLWDDRETRPAIGKIKILIFYFLSRHGKL